MTENQGRGARDRTSGRARWDDLTPDPPWSWDKKEPVRDPNAPVMLWQVDAETSMKDPRSDGSASWPDCEVLAYTARAMGVVVVLIETDLVSAEGLRHRRGIRTVKRATDRRYFDDGSPTAVIVSNGGTQWERVQAS